MLTEPASIIILSFLQKFGLDPDYYIPDRITEGYGISNQSIDYAKSKI